MKIIGLTGGIACGKSTVARMLSKLGAKVIDADAIARELSKPNAPLWKAYVSHFGEKILSEKGELDRALIGRIVFQDENERRFIDSVAHPLIEKRINELIAFYRERGEAAVVLDVPLLFETGSERLVDTVWVVTVDEATQLKRLAARNSLTEEEAKARIAAQMSLKEKVSRADVVFDNSGRKKATANKVSAEWQKLFPEKTSVINSAKENAEHERTA